MAKHKMSDLYQMQSLPLSLKISMTKRRIRDWISEYGTDGVYVSFSGGKDSTVLLDLVRQDYPNVEAVFVDTGLEYPEIREFVKTFDNVTWLRPKMNFKQVIEKYGYPFISKEVSNCVDGARKYLKILTDRQTDRQTVPNAPYMADILGIDRRINKNNQEYQMLRKGIIPSGSLYRLKRINGVLTNKNGEKSQFNQEKYKFFLDADFEISDKCCNVMKKTPAHTYEKETGKKPIIATMASESILRTQKWLHEGCNAFDATHPHSKPMSFWTEQDVLLYIKLYGNEIVERRKKAWNRSKDYIVYGNRIVSRKTGKTLFETDNWKPICPVYGDVVEDFAKQGQCEGQMNLSELGIFDNERPLLKTTGCSRTGCMFCGYGCHLEKAGEGRFERMKVTHPKQYDYIMRPTEEGGLNYKEVIDWINEHGNLNIRY